MPGTAVGCCCYGYMFGMWAAVCVCDHVGVCVCDHVGVCVCDHVRECVCVCASVCETM